jgi:hypothetical protein
MDETNGLGGLKDKVFTKVLQDCVEAAYQRLVEWHVLARVRGIAGSSSGQQ